MCQSGVSNSTSGDFGLDLSTIAEECTFAVKIWLQIM